MVSTCKVNKNVQHIRSVAVLTKQRVFVVSWSKVISTHYVQRTGLPQLFRPFVRPLNGNTPL